MYNTYKPLLFSIAYRFLGSVTDAEDAVQESFLAWSERGGDHGVKSVKAYLCRILCHKCADRIRLKNRRKEVYVGPWLPEPLIGGGETPEDTCTLRESLRTAYLLLLEQLSATERTHFVLREAFGFGYSEISQITGKSPANCRQIVHRAKRVMPASISESARVESVAGIQTRLAAEFAEAVEGGDIRRVVALLTDDAVLISDGGGKVTAALRPILDSQRIAHFLLGVWSRRPPGTAVSSRSVNGLPGYVFTVKGRVTHVLSCEFECNKISDLYLVANPDKLEHLNRGEASSLAGPTEQRER